MGFNLNEFYFEIAPFCFKAESYLGHCGQAYQICPFYTNL